MGHVARATGITLAALLATAAHAQTDAPGAGPPSAVNTPTPGESGAGTPAASAVPLLHGIILGEHGWIAYMEDPVTKVVGAYHVGDTVAGRTVETIEDTRVVLRGSDGRLEIKLTYEWSDATRKGR